MDATGTRNILLSKQARSTHETRPPVRSLPSYFSGSSRSVDRVVRLTPRELEVLSLLAEGLPNKLICRRLGISPGTVKIHVSRVLAELGVSSRLEAVIVAQRVGVLRVNIAAAEPPLQERPERLGREPRSSAEAPAAAGASTHLRTSP
jgi:DNA-binding NarL/FixJ family response regulator